HPRAPGPRPPLGCRGRTGGRPGRDGRRRLVLYRVGLSDDWGGVAGRLGGCSGAGSTGPRPGGATNHNDRRITGVERRMERLLTVEDAADRLGTSVRFVRRLIFERRIAFVKVGRHVRIAAADLDAYIRGGRVEVGAIPVLTRRRGA